jgi:hypothetical protein
MSNYQLTLIKNPAGTFSFVGTVPVKLGWLRKDGEMLTDDEVKQLARAQMPALLAQSRVFKTATMALHAADELGFPPIEVDTTAVDVALHDEQKSMQNWREAMGERSKK